MSKKPKSTDSAPAHKETELEPVKKTTHSQPSSETLALLVVSMGWANHEGRKREALFHQAYKLWKETQKFLAERRIEFEEADRKQKEEDELWNALLERQRGQHSWPMTYPVFMAWLRPKPTEDEDRNETFREFLADHRFKLTTLEAARGNENMRQHLILCARAGVKFASKRLAELLTAQGGEKPFPDWMPEWFANQVNRLHGRLQSEGFTEKNCRESAIAFYSWLGEKASAGRRSGANKTNHSLSERRSIK